jgi:hypothetical protein
VTWRAIEALLLATGAGDYDTMARALVTIGATMGEVDIKVRRGAVCVSVCLSVRVFVDGCVSAQRLAVYRLSAGGSQRLVWFGAGRGGVVYCGDFTICRKGKDRTQDVNVYHLILHLLAGR